MSAAIMGGVALLLIALGVGLYFLLSKKACKDHETQDDCKEPCKWDTYGNKCIKGDENLTAAPVITPTPPDDDDKDDDQSSPTPTTDGSKWKCYAGRYGDAYAEYLKNKSLDDVKKHYETVGKSKGWSTSCTLTADDVACYSLQNPEAFSNFGYSRSTSDKTGTNLAKHYKDIGRENVARFNCRGGKLATSTIPENASILTPREFNFNRTNGAYTTILTSPNGLYSLAIYNETKRGRLFFKKGNANVHTLLDSQLSNTDYEAGYTKLRFWFSGWEGNVFFRWFKPDGGNWRDHKSAVYLSSGRDGFANSTVTNNQHALVLTDTGKFYIDHGTGDDDDNVVVVEAEE